MVSSGIASLDRVLGGNGYPDQSAVLIIGPPGVGKEAFCYWFAKQGLDQDEPCIYATRLSVREVLDDQRAFGINPTRQQKQPFWLSREGGDAKLEVYDMNIVLDNIRSVLKRSAGRKARIIVDSLSSSLMVNSTESVYRAIDQIIVEAKQHDAVLLATVEEGMHPPSAIAAMQQLFDGCIELSLHRLGMKIFPLLRVMKMRGLRPELTYFRVVFTKAGPVLDEDGFRQPPDLERETGALEHLEGVSSLGFASETEDVFNYLTRSFVSDYSTARLSVDQAGWRTRGQIAEAASVTQVSLYGKAGKFGPILKDLISNGLIEIRYFPGERGRGGEVVKFRIAYEKDVVKRYLDRSPGVKEVGKK